MNAQEMINVLLSQIKADLICYAKSAADKELCHSRIEENMSRFNAILNDAENDLKYRLEESMQFAKDNVDVRLESLKSDLDKMRDSLFDKFEQKKSELLATLDLDENEPTQIKINYNKLNSEAIEDVQQQLEKAKSKIDTLNQTSLRVSFKESNFECTEKILGKIRCEINPILPNSSWWNLADLPFNSNSLTSTRTLSLLVENQLSPLSYGGGRHILTVDSLHNILVWDINTGQRIYESLREFNFRQAILLNDTCMVLIKNKELLVRLQQLDGAAPRSFITSGAVICVEKLADNFLITGEKEHMRGEKSSFLNLWRVSGAGAEHVARSEPFSMQIGTVKSIGFDFVAVLDDAKASGIVFKLVNGSFRLFYADIWPLRDFVALNEDNIVFIDSYKMFKYSRQHDTQSVEWNEYPSAEFLPLKSIFWIKRGKLGVLSPSCVWVFDASDEEIKLVSRVPARDICGFDAISEFIALDEGRFACKANNQVKIYRFE